MSNFCLKVCGYSYHWC